MHPFNGDPDVGGTALHEHPKGTQPNKSSSQLDCSVNPGTLPEGQVNGWALIMGANLMAEEVIVKLLMELLTKRGVKYDPFKIKLLLKFLQKNGAP